MAQEKKRLLYIDIVKVIALILMPIIHLDLVLFNMSEYYGLGTYQVDANLLGKITEIMYLFVPGIFMFCMGVGMAVSTHNTPTDYIKRGAKLLLIGFLLNVIRGFLLFGIWAIVVKDISFLYDGINWLLESDILYFVGLFSILFGLLKKLKLSDGVILLISVLMQIIGTLLPACDTGNGLVNSVIGNFVYSDSGSFFPVVLWTLYPVCGYLFQKKYMQAEDKSKYMCKFALLGAALFAVTVLALCLTGNWSTEYLLWGKHAFVMQTPSALMTIGLLNVYVTIWYFVSKVIESFGKGNLISKIASKVNSIYCIHWVLEMEGVVLVLLLFDVTVCSIFWVFAGGIVIFIIGTLLAFSWDGIRRIKNN